VKVHVSRVGDSVLVAWDDAAGREVLTCLVSPAVADEIADALISAASAEHGDALDHLLDEVDP